MNALSILRRHIIKYNNKILNNKSRLLSSFKYNNFLCKFSSSSLDNEVNNEIQTFLKLFSENENDMNNEKFMNIENILKNIKPELKNDMNIDINSQQVRLFVDIIQRDPIVLWKVLLGKIDTASWANIMREKPYLQEDELSEEQKEAMKLLKNIDHDIMKQRGLLTFNTREEFDKMFPGNEEHDDMLRKLLYNIFMNARKRPVPAASIIEYLMEFVEDRAFSVEYSERIETDPRVKEARKNLNYLLRLGKSTMKEYFAASKQLESAKIDSAKSCVPLEFKSMQTEKLKKELYRTEHEFRSAQNEDEDIIEELQEKVVNLRIQLQKIDRINALNGTTMKEEVEQLTFSPDYEINDEDNECGLLEPNETAVLRQVLALTRISSCINFTDSLSIGVSILNRYRYGFLHKDELFENARERWPYYVSAAENLTIKEYKEKHKFLLEEQIWKDDILTFRSESSKHLTVVDSPFDSSSYYPGNPEYDNDNNMKNWDLDFPIEVSYCVVPAFLFLKQIKAMTKRQYRKVILKFSLKDVKIPKLQKEILKELISDKIEKNHIVKLVSAKYATREENEQAAYELLSQVFLESYNLMKTQPWNDLSISTPKDIINEKLPKHSSYDRTSHQGVLTPKQKSSLLSSNKE